MDRAERTGFGVAFVGHAAVVGLLVWLAQPRPLPPVTSAFEVSFVDEVGLVSASPQPTQQPAAAASSPEAGPLEDAPTTSLPESAPPVPDARPVPPQPPLSSSPRQRPEPPRQRPVRELPRPTQAQPKQGRSGSSATGERTRRSRIGDEILEGLGDDQQSRSRSAPAAVMSAQAAANIAQAIQRQIQPCADRQVYPGPGSERIATPVNLRLNRDGSLAARPTVGRQRGIDDENGRYAERVADLAVRSFVECAPLRGLPADLYDVPRGWSNFVMNYRLPG